jgi:large subunit ribosomal protein L18
MSYNPKRLKIALKTRAKLKEKGKTRLCFYKTLQHTYAQIISSDGAKVITSASTLEKEIYQKCNENGGNKAAASVVGEYIAQRAIDKGIYEVGFDRSGFQYHGRVKSLAESARSNGLQF